MGIWNAAVKSKLYKEYISKRRKMIEDDEETDKVIIQLSPSKEEFEHAKEIVKVLLPEQIKRCQELREFYEQKKNGK